jgi:putative nucleotidyltransferase-like protein
LNRRDGNSSTTTALTPDAGDERAELWPAVDRLLSRARSAPDLELHRLELLARPSAIERGRPALGVRQRARDSALRFVSAPLLLRRVREVCSGPIVLLKGPETAAYYPDRSLRPFNDLDLLVPDPLRTQEALLAAGFAPVGDECLYVGIHHLRPLQYASHPMTLEIHCRPKWPKKMKTPPLDEIFAHARPAAIGVEGILAPSPAQHALLLAAHSWAHEPLGSLRQLIDIAAVRNGVDASELESLAERWQLVRVWRTTTRTIDGLLFGRRVPWPLRTWARNLVHVRDRTVLEQHLEQWLSPFAAYPVWQALGIASRALARDLRRGDDERWATKMRRTRKAIQDASLGRSLHDAEVALLENGRR